MTTVWRQQGSDWRPVAPSGFPNEKALHDLVAEAPDLLPLSGSPRLAVVGREVSLGTGWADLLAVETTGRPVIIEVKLRANPEARRAVVAQVLAYAASLAGASVDALEEALGVDLAESARVADQEGVFAADDFRATLEASLAGGGFRLVLVLDEVPEELVRTVGYLERVAERVVVDLISVSSFAIGDEQVLVPQRVDPVAQAADSTSVAVPSRRSADARPVEGADAYAERVARLSGAAREKHERLLRWARGLEAEGLVRLWSTIGKTQDVLQVRVPGEQVGLVTIWSWNEETSITLYASAFERRAPSTMPRVRALSAPVELGRALRGDAVSEELLEAIADAYREAGGAGPS